MKREANSQQVQLFMILQEHKGRAKAIKCRRVAKMMDVHPRTVRALVNSLIFDFGIPIIGDHSKGYYLVETVEEIESTTTTLKRHALHELWKAARIKKIAPAELIGQLTFDWFEAFGRDMPELDGDEGLPPHLVAITAILGRYQEDPEKYADELCALREKYSPLFVSREKIEKLKEMQGVLAEVLEGA